MGNGNGRSQIRGGRGHMEEGGARSERADLVIEGAWVMGDGPAGTKGVGSSRVEGGTGGEKMEPGEGVGPESTRGGRTSSVRGQQRAGPEGKGQEARGGVEGRS